MGQDVMRRPPKFVHGFLDRHGRPRFYFRRPGYPGVALPGLPWSPEFMSAYEQALGGQPVRVGLARVIPGTMRALAVSYFNSPAFRSMGAKPQRDYRHVIERLCKQHGDKRAATLQREHIVKLMAACAKPNAANHLRKVLRGMMKHAAEIGIRTDDPTRDVKAIRIKTDGYHSWTESEIAQFEARHPLDSTARLAFALLLYTGQRRADVVRLGRQHIRDGMLHIRQQKTAVELAIPVHPYLQAMVSNTTDRLAFLVNDLGRPFTVGSFSNWFRAQCDMANLRHCSAHGLRKAAARRLAEAGCTAHEIAAITGHASLREIVRYTKAADQRRLATAAMDKAKARTGIGKPPVRFAKKAK